MTDISHEEFEIKKRLKKYSKVLCPDINILDQSLCFCIHLNSKTINRNITDNLLSAPLRVHCPSENVPESDSLLVSSGVELQ